MTIPARLRIEATIPIPLKAVWDLMVQADRMPEWNTELAEVLDVSGNTDRVGGGYRQVWKLFGRRIESKHPWRITAVVPLLPSFVPKPAFPEPARDSRFLPDSTSSRLP